MKLNEKDKAAISAAATKSFNSGYVNVVVNVSTTAGEFAVWAGRKDWDSYGESSWPCDPYVEVKASKVLKFGQHGQDIRFWRGASLEEALSKI